MALGELVQAVEWWLRAADQRAPDTRTCVAKVSRVHPIVGKDLRFLALLERIGLEGLPGTIRSTKTANPRVDGSIPSLATISNFMICMRFRVSPADYPCPSMADPRTIGKWVGEGESRWGRGGQGTGDPETSPVLVC